MRHERRKQYRGYLKFFERTFGIRPRYKIICDGNFLHHFVSHNLGDDVKDLHRLLSTVLETDDIETFVVEAVLRELEDLGETRTLKLAKQMEALRVGTSLDESRGMEPPVAIKKLVGYVNRRKYIVATQDEELRRLLRDTPGVPLLFLQRVLIGLEAPSARSEEYWSKQEQSKLQVGKDERKRVREMMTTDKSESVSGTKLVHGDGGEKKTRKRHHNQAQ